MPAWDSQYDVIKRQSENLTKMLAEYDRTGGKGEKGKTKGNKGSKGSKGALGKFMSNNFNPKPKCGCCGKTNHTWDICWDKDKTCDICARVGHLPPMCTDWTAIEDYKATRRQAQGGGGQQQQAQQQQQQTPKAKGGGKKWDKGKQ